MFRELIASQFKKPTGLLGLFTSRMMIKGNKKNYDVLLNELDIKPHDRVLEIGYGPGTGIYRITQLSESCIVDGVDFSKLMYKKASRLNKLMIDKGNVHLYFGDLLNTPFAQDQYEKVFCLNVIYFWNDLSKPFEKIISLLKTKGVFHIYMANAKSLIAMNTPDSVFNKYTIEQVVEALKTTGFVTIEHHYNKGYFIKARKS